jgi:SNF2-related domain/SNF2 Helicase protein/Helicase conserved C-terminal domain
VLRDAGCTAAEAAPGTAVLTLPSDGIGPVPSPELAEELPGPEFSSPAAETAPPATHWRAPTVRLGHVAAAAVLTTLTRQAPDAAPAAEAPAVAGVGLRYLERLAAFADGLVERGRVLPSVRANGQGLAVTLWQPVVTGADAAWLQSAAAALPAACRAAECQEPGRTQVTVAVDALVDAAVRARIGTAVKPSGGTTRAAGPAHGRWRLALTAHEPTFPATEVEVATLQAALADWQREATAAGVVRACFRLVEPAAEQVAEDQTSPEQAGAESPLDVGWRLELALQASDEPSLVVAAEQIWAARGGLRALARHVPDPQERLLAELGRAVRLYPRLEPSLRRARPSVLPLDTAGAHDFLADTAPLLMAAGFGVLLPGWWTAPTARLGARLRAHTPSQPGATAGPAGIGQDGLVEFDWRLAVGEHSLTDQEVEDLVEAQQPLVRVRGQWVAVDPERLARARAFLQRRGRGAASRVSAAELLGMLAGEDVPGGLPLVGVDADGWLGDLLAGDGALRLQPVPVPDGFVGRLRPYQERGLAWLAFIHSIGLGGLLADDMGLGKTVQLLALIVHDAERDAADGPTLLVCPMSLVGNWQREAARFAPKLRVHVHHGAERTRGKAFTDAVAASDIVLTTYALLARDAAALRTVAWRRLVLDEAQAVKNAATRTAQAARSISAPHRLAVTGTPVENRLADLWSLIDFANPSLLGSAAQFKERFATPIERHGDADAGARLRSVTQPLVLRRLKTDPTIISDLPPKLEMEVACTLTAEQAALYQAVVADMLERIANSTGIERRGLVLASMTKLKQVCNHPAHFLRDGSRLPGRSGKLARLDETLEEVLATGEKALLFTQYVEFGGMLRSHLSARFGREVLFLHGGVAKADRDAMVNRFQQDGAGPPLFILSLKAGGTGLTLTAANHVVHVDRWWNPAVEDQATDRAFRIGQTRTVQVRKLVCAGTLEEKISVMIREKRGLAEAVVGTGEGWLTELSTSQLRQLFALEAGSVVE